MRRQRREAGFQNGTLFCLRRTGPGNFVERFFQCGKDLRKMRRGRGDRKKSVYSLQRQRKGQGQEKYQGKDTCRCRFRFQVKDTG